MFPWNPESACQLLSLLELGWCRVCVAVWGTSYPDSWISWMAIQAAFCTQSLCSAVLLTMCLLPLPWLGCYSCTFGLCVTTNSNVHPYLKWEDHLSPLLLLFILSQSVFALSVPLWLHFLRYTQSSSCNPGWSLPGCPLLP